MNCKNCNAEVSASAKFCSVCGTPVEQPAAVCRSCGAALVEGTKFCTTCGTAVEAPAAAVAAPVAPVEPQPVEPVAPVAPQPIEPVAPVAPQPIEPVAPVAPQPVEPAAPAAPQPVEPAAPVVPQPVEPAAPVVPQPVEPAAPAAPQPVEPAAPAAPQPVEPVAPAAPQPVEPVAPAAPVENNISMDIAGLDMSDASAIAVKPVKKNGGKIALIIILAVVAVLAIVGAICGIFFRGVIANLFMGDNKYAAMIEGKVFEAVTETEGEDLAELSDELTEAFSSAFTAANSTNNGDISSADELTSALAGVDLKDIISTYNAQFVEVYGTDGAVLEFDADLKLTEQAIADMGADSEIIDIINDSSLTMAFQAAKDALGLEISATDPEGFELSARCVLRDDGTVALLLPFGTDKCIKMTLDTDGAVSEVETVEFDIDAAEILRITNSLTDIYLKYYEMAEITIEKDSMKAAKVEANGRLIIAEMDEDLLGDMFEEMINFMIEDDYFMEKFAEFMKLAGEEYSESEIKDELESSIEDMKDDINFTFIIKTLVDNNSNLLAKSYAMDIEDEGEASFAFVDGENEMGLQIVIDDEDFLVAKITEENETTGKVEMTLTDADTEIGVDVAYENVTVVPYLNTEVPTGKYEIEIDADGEKASMTIDTYVDGDKIKNEFTIDQDEMGTIGLTMTCAPASEDLTAIPSDALDFTDATSWTEDETKKNAQYILDALNEIKAKCEAKPDSTFVGLVGDAVAEGVIYFEDLLAPKVGSEELSMVADGISELMNSLNNTYIANSEFVTDDLFNECTEVYAALDEAYNKVAYEYEMDQADYDAIVAEVNDLKERATELCDKMNAAAEDANQQGAALQGMWTAYLIEGYGEQMTPEEAEFTMNVMFYEDGTFMWNWDGEVTNGTWTLEDGIVTLVEEEWYYEFNYENGELVYILDDEITIRMSK